jgi:hypothetical protein
VHSHEIKPIWTSASFLVYTGGLTVLVSAIAALAYLSGNYESGGRLGAARARRAVPDRARLPDS